jgi:DNA repair photolyase
MTSAPRRVANPPNPWASTSVEWLDEPPDVRVEVFEEECSSALSENTSPDIPFRYSFNPYRGCQHACSYCYARPSHQYLGWGAGTDFDSKLVVKRNVVEVLRGELAARRWARGRDMIAFSGVTDCYQPLEASYELTRRSLEACDEFRHPVGVITKGALVRRDVALLARMAGRGGAHVALTIPFADPDDARALEPWAPTTTTRFETLRRLSESGIRTGISLSPVIPGLNDSAIPELLERARDAGATQAFFVVLRLPGEVAPVFEERLRASHPGRADKVLHTLREMRGGALNLPDFGARMGGHGPRYNAIQQLFQIHCRRLGLATERLEGVHEGEKPVLPRSAQQGELF